MTCTEHDMPLAADNETIDDFLGGSIRLIQPKVGYRVSMDTVLLAAAVPVLAGETVLEGGVGTGGAAICLAYRVKGALVSGIDMQAEMVAMARRNVALNNLSATVSVEEGCITDLSGPQSQYDHVMLNPPYLPAGKAIKPPNKGKGIAHMESNASLKDWLRFAIHKVKNKGTVTIVCRADRLDEIVAHLYRRVGDLIVMPLWPRVGVAAKRIIIQGRKGMRGGATLSPGLVLHGTEERYTAEALAILKEGEALNLKAFASKA